MLLEFENEDQTKNESDSEEILHSDEKKKEENERENEQNSGDDIISPSPQKPIRASKRILETKFCVENENFSDIRRNGKVKKSRSAAEMNSGAEKSDVAELPFKIPRMFSALEEEAEEDENSESEAIAETPAKTTISRKSSESRSPILSGGKSTAKSKAEGEIESKGQSIAEPEFAVGTLVFAKVYGYPFWPAKVFFFGFEH